MILLYNLYLKNPALDAAEHRPLRAGRRLGDGALQAQVIGELVLEDELRPLRRAESLPAKMTLEIEGVKLNVVFDGVIELG